MCRFTRWTLLYIGQLAGLHVTGCRQGQTKSDEIRQYRISRLIRSEGWQHQLSDSQTISDDFRCN